MMGLPSCRQVAAELSREQDAPETAARRRSLKLHLMMCHHCRCYARQLVWIERALRLARPTTAAPPWLPAHARARIRERLRHESDSQRPPI